jgi:hypothetical protein
MVKYNLEENEEEVNKIYQEVVKNARLSEDVLELEYITGTKIYINVVDLPDSLRLRIEGLKELIENTRKSSILASKN